MYFYFFYTNTIYGGIMIKKFKFFLFIFLFSLITLNLIFSLNILKKKIIKDDILRLHVVANSNLLEDQIIKLKIYEKVNDYIQNIASKTNSKNELISKIIENKDKILEISNEQLTKSNKNYSSTLKVGSMYYDKKQSVFLDMEKGTYDSINITLGNGEGKNIWSLIMPNKEDMDNLSNLDTILPGISYIYKDNSNSKEKVYGFKILEMIKGLN